MDRWSESTKHWWRCLRNLGKDWKPDWPKHQPELVHAYNSMRSAITGYSLHYMMFGWWPCACPLAFIFSLLWAQKKHQHVNHYIADLCEWLCMRPSRKYKCTVFYLGLKGRGDTMIVKPMLFHWNQVTWSWWKPMPTKGWEKWKTSGRRNCMKQNVGLLKASLPTSWRNSGPDMLMSPPSESTYSHHPHNGSSFMYRCMSWTELGAPPPVLEQPTWKVSENQKVSQSAKCLLLAQCQTGETLLGWVNRKLHAFLRMFSGQPPCQTKGERFDVVVRGYVDINVGVLDAEVLITPMKSERYDWSWFLQSHLSSF